MVETNVVLTVSVLLLHLFSATTIKVLTIAISRESASVMAQGTDAGEVSRVGAARADGLCVAAGCSGGGRSGGGNDNVCLKFVSNEHLISFQMRKLFFFLNGLALILKFERQKRNCHLQMD